MKENSRLKIRIFRGMAVSLPFLFIILLEILLRIFQVGDDYSLFVQSDERAGHLMMNPLVSEKYFTQKQNATVGYFEPFHAEKQEGTFRVFVMGASTAVGFPYLHNGSFHRMLRHRLEQTYPDTDFEVINLALTAINSYALQDMAEEVIEQQPDAVLIYAGHNEYYGTLGVGSTSQLGSFPALVRLSLKLRELRIIQLCYDAYFSIMLRGENSDPDLQENLMKRMVRQQEIPHGSDLYRAGITQFDSNMDLLLETLTDAEVPVYLSNLISNEKAQKPFISHLQPHTDQLRWTEHYDKLKLALNANNYQIALEEARSALQLDSTHAEIHFLLGKVLLGLGKKREARDAFQAATRYDALRFRAPPEINQLIEEKAEEYEAHFVNTNEIFRLASQGGIIGEELVLEHLHPNLEGYFLMADAFYRSLVKEPRLLNPQLTTLADAREVYPLTEVDSLLGIYATMILKEGWPFYESITIDTTHRSLPEAIAGALAVKQISWQAAMEKLYQHYHQRNVYDSALRVMEAVILEYPERPEFKAKAGSLCMKMGDFGKGSAFFKKAYRQQANPRFAYFAALCLLQQGALNETYTFLQDAFGQQQPDADTQRLMTAVRQILQMESQLKTSPNAGLLSRLARNYFLVGLGEEARQKAEESLSLEPDNPEAVLILQQLNEEQNS